MPARYIATESVAVGSDSGVNISYASLSVFGAVRAESFLTAPDHSQFPGFVCESEACVKCAIGFLLLPPLSPALADEELRVKPWIFVKHVFMVSGAQNQNCMPSAWGRARTERKKNNTKHQTKTALLCTSEQVHNRYTMQIFGNSLTSLGGRTDSTRVPMCSVAVGGGGGWVQPSSLYVGVVTLGRVCVRRKCKRYIGKLQEQLFAPRRTESHTDAPTPAARMR